MVKTLTAHFSSNKNLLFFQEIIMFDASIAVYKSNLNQSCEKFQWNFKAKIVKVDVSQFKKIISKQIKLLRLFCILYLNGETRRHNDLDLSVYVCLIMWGIVEG